MEYFKKFYRGELYEGRGMYLPHVTLSKERRKILVEKRYIT